MESENHHFQKMFSITQTHLRNVTKSFEEALNAERKKREALELKVENLTKYIESRFEKKQFGQNENVEVETASEKLARAIKEWKDFMNKMSEKLSMQHKRKLDKMESEKCMHVKVTSENNAVADCQFLDGDSKLSQVDCSPQDDGQSSLPMKSLSRGKLTKGKSSLLNGSKKSSCDRRSKSRVYYSDSPLNQRKIVGIRTRFGYVMCGEDENPGVDELEKPSMIGLGTVRQEESEQIRRQLQGLELLCTDTGLNMD